LLISTVAVEVAGEERDVCGLDRDVGGASDRDAEIGLDERGGGATACGLTFS